jgi:predicted Zn-dependent peptidase
MMLKCFHRTLAIGAGLATMLLAIAGLASAEDGPEAGPQELRTPGGISYSYQFVPDAKKVSIYSAWRTDWAEKGLQPAAPFVGTQLLLSGGAGTRDAATISADYAALNARTELYSSGDFVRGFLGVTPDQLDAASLIAADELSDPLFDNRWFARIKSSKAASLRQNLQHQSNQSSRLIQNLLFLGQPISSTFAMTAEAIDQLDLETVRTWHRAVFTRSNLHVAVAGSIHPDAVARSIDRMFMRLPLGSPVQSNPLKAIFTPRKSILLHTPNISKSYVSIAGILPPLTVKPGIEAFVGTLALSNGESSRLNAAIRNQLRATYGLSAGVANLTHNFRIIYMVGEVDGTKMKDALVIMRDAYENLRLNGVTKVEFDTIRQKIVANLATASKQPDFVASSLLETKLSNLSAARDDNILEVARNATFEQINSKIRQDFPAFDDMVKVVVTADDKAIAADCAVLSPDAFDVCLN